MTDLASQRALTRSAPNLPLSWYFDPKILEVEKKLLFARGPGYVGHEQMAPNPGDYRVLDGARPARGRSSTTRASTTSSPTSAATGSRSC
jgi:hypothetical protein